MAKLSEFANCSLHSQRYGLEVFTLRQVGRGGSRRLLCPVEEHGCSVLHEAAVVWSAQVAGVVTHYGFELRAECAAVHQDAAYEGALRLRDQLQTATPAGGDAAESLERQVNVEVVYDCDLVAVRELTLLDSCRYPVFTDAVTSCGVFLDF
jgi:hypothetical protein